MQLLRQSNQGHRIVVRSPFGVTRLRPIQDAARESQGCPGKVSRRLGHELPVEEGNLEDVQCKMLYFRVVGSIDDGDLKKAVDSRVSNGPSQRLQNVPLHLDEHVVIVQRAAHRLQLLDCGNTVLLVSVLGGDEECCTANELVMSLVHNTLRAVSVEEVDGQEESGRQELECGVRFDQEVKQIRAHEPLDLRLNVNRVDIGKRSRLEEIGVSQCDTNTDSLPRSHMKGN